MIKKICLTGGPGVGETSVLNKIKEYFTPLGFKVIICDETATYFINKGIKPFGDGKIDMVNYQKIIMKFQTAKEEIFDYISKIIPGDNVLIVYDRGTIDNFAYINNEESKEVLNESCNKNFVDLMNQYDLVIALVGEKKFYTTENNKARSEDPNTALKMGKENLKNWLGHNNLKIVLPKDTIEEKIDEVLNIIAEELNQKQIIRQEKFLIDLANTNIEHIYQIGKKKEITQTYLISKPNIEKRLRKEIFNECESYYLSVFKLNKDGTKTTISVKEITKNMYDTLIEFKDEEKQDIIKTRIYFNHNGQYLHLDIFSKDSLGILEINVNKNENLNIPNFITVIENVTNNFQYYNKNLANKNYQKVKKEQK